MSRPLILALQLWALFLLFAAYAKGSWPLGLFALGMAMVAGIGWRRRN